MCSRRPGPRSTPGDAWSQRLGSGARSQRWPCHEALPLHTGYGAAPGCTRHDDAVGCLLEWGPHAAATALINERSLRSRAHQLTQVDGHRRWAVLAAGRDLPSFADQAATAGGVGPGARRRLRIGGTAADGSELTVDDRVYPVPVPLRAVIANHRAVRLADGFPERAELLRVSEGSALQFSRHRDGDPDFSGCADHTADRTPSHDH